jgi:sulfotransferase family protein
VPLLEITEVAQAPPSEALLASYLDSPAPGTALERTTFEVAGWALGRHSEAQSVELVSGDELIRVVPLWVERTDVAAAHRGAPAASGFWSLCGSLVLEREFRLDVRAVLADGTRAAVGSITGRREPIRTSYEPQLKPLLVTSLGRTGTTLLMGLLAAHPAVVAHRTYPYEIFPARYWLHLLRVLAEPADYAHSSHPSNFTEDIWKVGYNPFHSAPATHAPELADLFGRSYVERLARFCQESIDDFYRATAVLQQQPHAALFAEKFQPDALPRLAWDLYPEMKEIVLVRDFRDLICSVFAFNEKRGTVDFGRDGLDSDADYVRYVGGRARQLLEAAKSRRGRAELVRYEDLATDPGRALARLLPYLGVDDDPGIVEAMVRGAFDQPGMDQHRTSSSVDGSIGRWKNELPRALHPVVAETLDPVLAELGYEV